ncbi:hypothetical protein ABZW44_29445 [Streptomyces mirabilis]|uniref:hypothetical protein n=1 Tax=Streptomyces mirabilis TaxID=68239 RepID=UPI0033B0CE06
MKPPASGLTVHRRSLVRLARVTAGPPRRPTSLRIALALAVAHPCEQKVPLVLGLLWHDDLGQAEDEGHHKRRHRYVDHS